MVHRITGFLHWLGQWEPGILVLLSFALQVFMLAFGRSRPRRIKISPMLDFVLWLAYQGADKVAIYILGHLALIQCLRNIQAQELQSFWAPILLLHLGGPDAITAYAIEDNELWGRHFFELVSQVAPTIYVWSRLVVNPNGLFLPTTMMLGLGIVKFCERTWALRCASSSSLRKSMDRDPEVKANRWGLQSPRPNRAMDSCPKSICRGHSGSYERTLREAHSLFPNFERLFSGLKLSRDIRDRSQEIFDKMTAEQAFQVVELELSLMYDVLYTKAAVIHTWPGRFIRLLALASTPAILGLFVAVSKAGYRSGDVVVTYVLLVGAVLVEYYAFSMALFSTWSYAFFVYWNCRALAEFVLKSRLLLQPKTPTRRFHSVGQFNLIDHCLETSTASLWVYLGWGKPRATHIELDDHLKSSIFDTLKELFKNLDRNEKRSANMRRGKFTLELHKCYELLPEWEKHEKEFYDSIIIWHIATDCVFTCDNAKGSALAGEAKKVAASTKKLSDYMLFLLVHRPLMIPIDMEKSFDEACSEFSALDLEDWHSGKETICDVMVGRRYERYRSEELDNKLDILPKAWKLAAALRKLGAEKRWEMMRAVWVEMMCNVARGCDGYFHAKQLSTGGELLTFVWLQAAHLGLGTYF